MFNENAVQWLTLQSQYLVIYVAQFNYCLLTIPIQEVAEGQRVCGSENKRPDFMTNQYFNIFKRLQYMYNACEIDMNAIYVCFQNKKILGEICEAPYTLGENRRACMSEA